MLMYRRIDVEDNQEFMPIPEHLFLQIEEDQRAQEAAIKRQELDKYLCKFRLISRHPVTGESLEKRIEVHQDWTLLQTVEKARELLGLQYVVSLSRCRLVKYDEYTETLDQSLEEKEDQTFGQMVGGPRNYYAFELFLEIREEGEVFRVYNRGGLNLKVLVVDLVEGEVRPAVPMRAEQGWKVVELKEAIAEKLNLPVDCMNLALETYQNEGKHLAQPNQLLKNEGLFRKHSVFVCCDPEDIQKPFKESEMYKLIDRHVNSILLYITIPPPPKRRVKEVDVTEERPLQRTIELRIDRRLTVSDLKERLEEYVQQSSSNFKIYRLYSNNQEYEMYRINDALTTVPNETKMIVRLGRALKPGEIRVRLSLLRMNEVDFFKPLMDSIITKGMTVKEFKKQLIQEAYDQGVEYPLQLDRIRLRKKTWSSAVTVFLDDQVFEKDIHVFANFEMYVEPLEGPEPMTCPTQMQVYLRRWHPSTYTVDPVHEIILLENTPEHLRSKIAEASGIPVQHVAFAKANGSFPCEVPVLDIEKDMDWNPNVSTISSKPLSMYDDGVVLYYKDTREKLMELMIYTDEDDQPNNGSRED